MIARLITHRPDHDRSDYGVDHRRDGDQSLKSDSSASAIARYLD
jgi:hypothetical protein